MITFIIVSHSHKISDGIVDMITQMVPTDAVNIVSAGGTDDGGIGTDPMRIQSYVEQYADSERIYLFGDIGSSIMSIDMVLELISDDLRQKCFYIDAPIVEGAFVGAVQTMVDSSHEAILREIAHTKSD